MSYNSKPAVQKSEGVDIYKLYEERCIDSINHLVVLHKLFYGVIDEQDAFDYLNSNLRDDADLADMGRNLKYQYKMGDNEEDLVAFFIHRQYETGEIIEVEMLEVLDEPLEFNNRVNEAFQERCDRVLREVPATATLVRLRVINEEHLFSPKTHIGFEVVDYEE